MAKRRGRRGGSSKKKRMAHGSLLKKKKVGFGTRRVLKQKRAHAMAKTTTVRASPAPTKNSVAANTGFRILFVIFGLMALAGVGVALGISLVHAKPALEDTRQANCLVVAKTENNGMCQSVTLEEDQGVVPPTTIVVSSRGGCPEFTKCWVYKEESVTIEEPQEHRFARTFYLPFGLGLGMGLTMPFLFLLAIRATCCAPQNDDEDEEAARNPAFHYDATVSSPTDGATALKMHPNAGGNRSTLPDPVPHDQLPGTPLSPLAKLMLSKSSSDGGGPWASSSVSWEQTVDSDSSASSASASASASASSASSADNDSESSSSSSSSSST